MYRDLREWLELVEKAGELRRVRAQVDWDEEMAAITCLVASEIGAPSLLFDNIKGYQPGQQVLFNILGSSIERIALAMGLPSGLSAAELIRRTREKLQHRIPPRPVDPRSAPIMENVHTGDDIDLFTFPVPKMWPLDGGRYLGTADAVITRDPDSGTVNMGTYRQMIEGKDQLGFYVSPGKDALLQREKYWRRGEPCPVVGVFGVDPLTLIISSSGFPKHISEYDFIGGMRGEAEEIFSGSVTGLPIPARAEIAIEGFAYPGGTRPEGPLGEFTGYYGRPAAETPVIEVKAVYHRNNPVLTSALTGDYPACEQNTYYSIIRSARIWDDLETLGIPGIKGVYAFPASAAAFGMIAVSLKQQYAGHVAQTLALAAQCPGAAYYTKWIVAVDEDVDPTDFNQVIWAMSTRCSPVDDIDILRNTWSTWLDPSQNPPEKRPYGSKALINACMDHRYIANFSKRTRLSEHMYRQVCARWEELGMPGSPPKVEKFHGES